MGGNSAPPNLKIEKKDKSNKMLQGFTCTLIPPLLVRFASLSVACWQEQVDYIVMRPYQPYIQFIIYFLPCM